MHTEPTRSTDSLYIRPMERRQLEFFLAIADAGSFTRAAGRLDIAQPSLSHAIRTLESELGTPLFDRLGRGVRLTAAGEAFLAPARRTVRSFSIAAGSVKAAVDGAYGRIVIVSSTLWAIEPLVRVMGEFRQIWPGVQLVVRDPLQRLDVLEQVRSGDADFGLVDGPAPGGTIGSQWLVDHELVAVLPPGTGPRSATASMTDLVAAGLISTPQGTALRSLLDGQLEAAGEVPDVAVETAHVASVLPLVLAGAGATVLPEGLAAEAAAKGARVLRLDPPTRVPVSLIWRDGRLSGVSESFLHLAQDLFSLSD